MTEAQMKEQLQAAQDMIETIAQQRDANANQVVQLVANNKALQRKIAELEKAAGTEPELDLAAPKANGHEASATVN